MKRSRTVLMVLGVVWVCAVGAGFGLMFNFSTKPGPVAASSAQWPKDSKIVRTPGRATLVMFAHPHCPCTRASIGELAVLHTRAPDLVTSYVLFVAPTGASTDWEKTDLWQSASAIPGVTALKDKDGVEAKRFNAIASGQTMLYFADGQLRFSGGITAARGQSGDNAGRDAIVSLLRTGTAERTSTSVFGCVLHDPDPATLQTDTTWKK